MWINNFIPTRERCHLAMRDAALSPVTRPHHRFDPSVARRRRKAAHCPSVPPILVLSRQKGSHPSQVPPQFHLGSSDGPVQPVPAAGCRHQVTRCWSHQLPGAAQPAVGRAQAPGPAGPTCRSGAWPDLPPVGDTSLSRHLLSWRRRGTGHGAGAGGAAAWEGSTAGAP